jgi:hypothetical protein
MITPKKQLNENRESILKASTVEQAIEFPAILSHPFVMADILYEHSVKTQLLKEKT